MLHLALLLGTSFSVVCLVSGDLWGGRLQGGGAMHNTPRQPNYWVYLLLTNNRMHKATTPYLRVTYRDRRGIL